MAVEMLFEKKKVRYFVFRRYITDKIQFEQWKEQEVRLVKKVLEKDDKYIQDVISGSYHTYEITGSTFKKVEAKYLSWKAGGFNMIEECDIKESPSFPLAAYMKYSDWLKEPGVKDTPMLTLFDVVMPEKLAKLKTELLNAQMINDNWKWIHKPVKYAAILVKSLCAWDYSDRDISNIDVHAILKNTFKIVCAISTVEHQQKIKVKTDFYKQA